MINRFSNFIVFISIMVVISIFSIGGDFVFEEKAKKMAEKKYFTVGCLSLNKIYFYKNIVENYDVNIDGEVYNYLDIMISGFPFTDESYFFFKNIKKDVKCYSVKYVEVDLLFYKRRYIYDFN